MYMPYVMQFTENYVDAKRTKLTASRKIRMFQVLGAGHVMLVDNPFGTFLNQVG